MQRILDLIEATLDAEITPAELAEKSGYSLWHFLHLFQQQVGMPLRRYQTKRRLAHAIWHISQGMSITDAALRWGFATHSGFYRAFARVYGMPPSVWLAEHRAPAPRVPLLKEEVFKMLTREKFCEALACWQLNGLSADDLRPVAYPSGHISDSAMYVGDTHMLKAYRDESACRLSAALSQALARSGMPAACPLPLPGGETMLPVSDGIWMTLIPRIPGRPMQAAELIRTPESGRRIGAALARLHLAAAGLEEELCPDDEPYAEQLLQWAIPKANEALPGAFPADYAARVEALPALPTAIVHRDPNPSNLIDTGSDIGFIDFDLSRRCVRIFDPCYTATAVLSETFGRDELPWRENWPVFCKALLEGYDSVSPLTPAEWAAVPTMLLGNEALCLAAFAGSSKYADVFDVNARMLGWMRGESGVMNG